MALLDFLLSGQRDAFAPFPPYMPQAQPAAMPPGAMPPIVPGPSAPMQTNDPFAREPIPVPSPRPADAMTSLDRDRAASTRAAVAAGSYAPAPGGGMTYRNPDAATSEMMPRQRMPSPFSMAPASGGGSIMDKLFKPENAPLFLAMAGGFSGAPSIGTGMRRAFSTAAPIAHATQTLAAKKDLAEAKLAGPRAVYAQLVQQGVPPGLALAASQNSEMLKYVSERYMGKGEVRPATDEERAAYGVKPDQPLAINAATGKPMFGPAQTNVNVAGEEKAFERAAGGKLYDYADSVLNKATQANDQFQKYDQIGQLLSDPNVYTGTFGGGIAGMKKAAKTVFGLDIQGVEQSEVAEKLRNALMGDLKEMLPGPMNNAEREFLTAIPPSLADSPEGIQLFLQVAKRTADAAAARAQKLEQIMAEEGGRLTMSGRLKFDSWARQQQIFPPGMMDEVKRVAKARTVPRGPTAGSGAALDDIRKRYGLY